jgi:hypothetical protein
LTGRDKRNISCIIHNEPSGWRNTVVLKPGIAELLVSSRRRWFLQEEDGKDLFVEKSLRLKREMQEMQDVKGKVICYFLLSREIPWGWKYVSLRFRFSPLV